MLYDVKITDTNDEEYLEIPKTINWLRELAQSGVVLKESHNFEIVEGEGWMNSEEKQDQFCDAHELVRHDAVLTVTDVTFKYEGGKTVICYATEEAEYEDEEEEDSMNND